VRIIAHRGASGVRIENTLPAFREAIRQGATALEMDIRRAGSGELVVFHDDDLSRLAGRGESVEDLPLRELRKVKLMDSALPGQEGRIPTLEEVVNDEVVADALSDALVLCLEIKAEGMEYDLVDFIRERDLVDSVIIYSFKIEHLVKVRFSEPRIRTNLLFGGNRDYNLKLALEHGVTMINPEGYDADEEFVARALDAGLEVTVGRTNDWNELVRLVGLPIWGIHSDFPDRALRAIKYVEALWTKGGPG